MNWLPAIAVLLRIAPVPHLDDRCIQLNFRVIVPFRHLEIQHENSPTRPHHHVRTAMARCILYPKVHANDPETHAQEACVPGLVAGEIAGRVPLTEDPRKICTEPPGKSLEFVFLKNRTERPTMVQRFFPRYTRCARS